MTTPAKLETSEEIRGTSSTEDVPISDDIEKNPIPFFRSTRWQAAVLGASFFCGPGMYSALNALGAGGLENPKLVNITSGYSFGMNAVFCFFGGVYINLVGVKATLSTGLIGFSLYGASLYTNNKYGTEWFLYFSSAIQGFFTAVLWVVQGAIMLAYPEPSFRGRSIATWYSCISLGQIVGASIALGINAKREKSGSISSVTYIPIIAISCLGPFIALLLSSPGKVVRRDGISVEVQKQLGPLKEAKRILSSVKRKEMIFLIPLFIYSQWFNSYEGTFVTVYHSVRGRALGSFMSAVTSILGCWTSGFLLDKIPGPRSTKFRRAYYFIYALNTIAWIWATVVQWYYQKTNPVGLDWTQGEFYASFLLFIFWKYADNCFQVFYYALVGTLSPEIDELARYIGFLKAVNTGGAALGYGVQVTWSLMGAEAIILVLWLAQVVPTWFVVRKVKDL